MFSTAETLLRLDTETAEGRAVANDLVAERGHLRFVVPMKLAGKSRPQIYANRGRRYSDAHRAFEAACVALARASWRGRVPLTEPVELYVVAYFHRPQKLAKARKWWGTPRRLYTGKPDLDNALGLPMDALVKAKVIADDTLVANQLFTPLQRWHVAIADDGRQGRERVEISLLPPTPWRP